MADDVRISAWPALEGAEPEALRELAWEWAVWGKVHGAPSDFRWIAATGGFDLDAGLENELTLGSEDLPEKAQAWRNLGELCSAVALYPSRARDAAGRSGFLEKQVFVWRRPEAVPAALGALALLPRAARATDDVWWEERDEPRLHDPDFVLDLPEETNRLDVGEVAEALERGRRHLVEAVAPDDLAEVYAALLAGARAVPLVLAEPLPAEALAALLLPLPRVIADRLSLSGWLPSSRFEAERLATRWELIMGERASELEAIGPEASKAERRQARAWVEALEAGTPDALAVPAALPKPPAAKPSGDDEVEIALWGPSAAGKTVLLAQLYLGRANARRAETPWEIFPTEISQKFADGMRQKIKGTNQFPAATAKGDGERIVYRFHNPESGARASLSVEDRAGADYETLAPDARERLRAADGLVLVFDPIRDRAKLEIEVEKTLEEVHIISGRDVAKDPRPIAVCVSKADLLIQTPEDARFAREDSDTFVRQRVDAVLTRLLDSFCDNYRLFAVSAAGLRLQHGVIEPTVFYDENLTLRIRRNSSPFNLMAPFAWVLDQVAAR